MLVSIMSVSCVIIASDNYLSKLYKWDKENVMLMFRSYLRIITGSYGSLTLDSYIIKPCKWNQKMTL